MNAINRYPKQGGVLCVQDRRGRPSWVMSYSTLFGAHLASGVSPQSRPAGTVAAESREHRHILAKWLFFANRGEFRDGDINEIMNKTSCLSLLSNAVVIWNTIHMQKIV